VLPADDAAVDHVQLRTLAPVRRDRRGREKASLAGLPTCRVFGQTALYGGRNRLISAALPFDGASDQKGGYLP
jgi:hypothetical protein